MASRRLLLVEDSSTMRRMLSPMLERARDSRSKRPTTVFKGWPRPGSIRVPS